MRGLVVSLLVKRVRSVTPYSLRLGLGAYVLKMRSAVCLAMSSWNSSPRSSTLTRPPIVQNGAWDTPLVLFNIAVTLVSH